MPRSVLFTVKAICAFTVVLLVAPVSAQECRACRIDVTESAIIKGRQDGGELISDPSQIARDTKGRLFVALPWSAGPEPPLVFDASGRFLQRIGTVGSGPNEYRQPIVILVTPGDTVVVFDQRLARMSVLSPDLRLVRTATVGELRDVARAPDGSLIARSDFSTNSFLLLSGEGKRLRTLRDSDTTAACTDITDCQLKQRRLITADGTGFWSVNRYGRHVVERRTWTGAMVHRFPVFPETAEQFGDKRGVIETRITGIWLDDDVLWVVGNKPSAGTRVNKDVQNDPRLANELLLRQNELFDGFVSAFDARDGKLLTSQRLEHIVSGVAAPGLIFSTLIDDDGFREVRLQRVSLSRKVEHFSR